VRPALLVVLVAVLAAAASADGRDRGAAPSARILFSSSASPALGEHVDVVRVDPRGVPRLVADLGPGRQAAPSPDGRLIAFLRVTLGGGPGGLFVMNRDGSGMRELLRADDLGEAPLDWSPDGRSLAFLGLGPRIGIVDIHSGRVQYLREEYVEALAWSPGAGRIAFHKQPNEGRVFVANRDGSAIRPLGRGAWPRWSPDGRRLVVVLEGDLWLVTVADGARRRLAAPRLEATGAYGWSPDGRRLAFVASHRVGNTASPGLWIVEIETGRLRRHALVSGGTQYVSWSRDGRWISLAREDGLLGVVGSRPGSRVRTLDAWPRRRVAGPPHWERGGRLVLSTVAAANDREIWIANADGTGARALTTNRVADIEPTASGDGTRIAYVLAPADGGRRAIHVMRADGSGKRPLLPHSFPSHTAPAWSPTRDEIAFVSGAYVYLVPAAGGRPRRLAAGEAPAWSPDGRRLAVERGGIWLVGRDGSGLRRVVARGRRPSFAPDGTRIAFQRPVSESANGIFVADVRSGSERFLAEGRDPSWAPDGSLVAFDRRSSIWAVPAAGGEPMRIVGSNGSAEHAAWATAAS
jgi:Tol biopolymer transport system component